MPLKGELIYIDNKDETDRIARYYEQGDKLVVVFKGSFKELLYTKERTQIIKLNSVFTSIKYNCIVFTSLTIFYS